MLFDESPNDDTQALPPPFVSCSYHLLEVRIKCGQTSQPPQDEPVGLPEATEDRDVLVQGLERLRSTEGGGQLLHPPINRQGVTQSFEQPDLGTKLVIDGHAGNISLASNGINGETREARACYQQFPGSRDDARSRLFRGRLALAETIGARTHWDLTPSKIHCIVCISK